MGIDNIPEAGKGNDFLSGIENTEGDELKKLIRDKLDENQNENVPNKDSGVYEVADNIGLISNKTSLDSNYLKGLIDLIFEKGNKEADIKLAENISNVNTNAGKQIVNNVNKAYESGNNEMAKSALVELAKYSFKTNNSICEDIINCINKHKDSSSIKEVSENIGLISEKVNSKTIKDFVSNVTEMGDSNSMLKIAKNIGSENPNKGRLVASLVDKDGESSNKEVLHSFIKKVLELPDYNKQRILIELSKNKELINNLDEDTKSTFLSEADNAIATSEAQREPSVDERNAEANKYLENAWPPENES